jgi:hypothetical protein
MGVAGGPVGWRWWCIWWPGSAGEAQPFDRGGAGGGVCSAWWWRRPCMGVGFLRTDLGENLLSATAKTGGGGAICIVPFLKASPWRSSRPLSATSGGNPRSDDDGALVSFLPWGRHSWRYTRDRGTRGRILWWSGASSYTLIATDLDGVAQCRFGVRCGRMDSRRRTTLSGVVVASMAERPGTVHAIVHLRRWIGGRWLQRPHTRQASWLRSAPDW